MATPVFTLGGERGWPVKEGKLLGYAQDENGLYRPIPVNFTRNSKSWVNRNGTLVEKAANVPTIGGTGTGKLVLQPERENKLLEDLTGPGYNSVDLTRSFYVSNQGLKFYKGVNTGPNSRIFNSSYTFIAEQEYVLSVTVDRNLTTSEYITIRALHGSGGFVASASLKLSDLVASDNGHASINSLFTKDLGNNLVRFSLAFTAEKSETGIIYAYASNSGNGATTTTSGEEIIYGNFQITKGTYPTETIITDGAAVTRLADLATLDNIQAQTGTTSSRFAILLKAEGRGVNLGGSNSYARFFNSGFSEQIRLDFTGERNFRFRDVPGGYANIGGVIVSPNTSQKMLFSVDGSTARLFFDGAKVGGNYTGTGWNIDKIQFGTGYQLSLELTEIYADALTDQDCINLTT